MELHERRTVKLGIQAGTKQPIQCFDIERADGQPLEAVVRQRSFEVQRKVASSLPSLGDEDADRLLLEATSYELERARRGSIEPLNVVHRHHDRARLGQRAKHAEDAQRDRPRVRRGAFCLPPQQRDLERAPLRLG